MLALSRFFFTSSIVSSALAASFTVKVGADGLAFTPNQVTAKQGDEIIFEFHPKNHTLTQSTLAAPCSPVAGGGDSGFIGVAATATTFPTKRLIVPDDTTPLWFYCKQGTHCQSGMVFAVNGAAKMDQFIANAKASGGGAAPPASTPPASSTPPPASPNTETGTTQTVSSPAATSSTPAIGGTTAKEIQISVGQGGLTFTPDRATAAVGDKIIFSFKAGAHTVTQSTFAAPCTPNGGADSGAMPVAAGTTVFPNFTFPVTDISKPIWFFCKTGNHCAQGMVFSLNAPTTGNTADAFKAAAMASGGYNAAGGAGNTTTPAGSNPAAGAGDGASSRVAGASAALVFGAALAGLLL